MAEKRRKRTRALAAIGWREWIALPDLAIPRIKVKVDTGARSSALHASQIVTFRRDGEPWIRFQVHPLQRDPHTTVAAEAPLVDERLVRSSSGHQALRPVIHTTLTLGSAVWEIDITLVRRDVMGFRMLLGRAAVRGRFLVDAGHSFLHGRPAAATLPAEPLESR